MSVSQHIYSVERDNEVLRRVRLWSDTERGRVSDGGYIVRVGISRNKKITWFGQWSQLITALPARTPVDLTGLADLNFPLQPGDVCVVQVFQSGQTSQNTIGLTTEWKFGRVGDTTRESVARRMDEATRPRPYGAKPLFSLGRHISDPEIRQAVEPIEESLNNSGITEWVLSSPLPEVRGLEGIVEGAVFDYGAEIAFTDGEKSKIISTTTVTLAVPDLTVPYRLHAAFGAAMHPVAPPAGESYGEAFLWDSVSGTVVAPYPQPAGAAVGLKAGDYAAASDETYANVTGVNVGWRIPANQATVTLEVWANSMVGDLEWHDPWISARLLRDPYLV